jgi:hypothetical protein
MRILTALILSTACTSLTTMHTAKPIVAGETEIGIIPHYYGAEGVGIPNVEVQVRHGINENMDFGVKYTFPVSLTADFNIALVNTGSFALSLDPTISPMYISASDASTFILWAFVPVLVDVFSTDWLTLTLGGKGGMVYATGSAGDIGVADGASFMVGGSAGAKFMFSESFGMMPEFNILTSLDAGGLLYTIGVGILF